MRRLIAAFLAALTFASAAHAGQLFPYEGNGSDGRKAMAGYEAMVGAKAYGATDFIDKTSWSGFDGGSGGLGSAQSYDFAYSLTGSSWTTIGSGANAGASGGIYQRAVANWQLFTGSTTEPAGRLISLTAIDPNGNVLLNPDFTAQQPGTTSFADAAVNSNPWTLSGVTQV